MTVDEEECYERMTELRKELNSKVDNLLYLTISNLVLILASLLVLIIK